MSCQCPLLAVEAGAPSQPNVDEITPDSVTLSWEKPRDDGGSKIQGYIKEKKPKDGDEWEEVTSTPVQGTQCKVMICTTLTEKHNYWNVPVDIMCPAKFHTFFSVREYNKKYFYSAGILSKAELKVACQSEIKSVKRQGCHPSQVSWRVKRLCMI